MEGYFVRMFRAIPDLQADEIGEVVPDVTIRNDPRVHVAAGRSPLGPKINEEELALRD